MTTVMKDLSPSAIKFVPEMARQSITIYSLAMHGLAGLSSLTARDVLDSPFFVLKGLSAVPHVEQDLTGRMSGNVSKTARKVLFFSASTYASTNGVLWLPIQLLKIMLILLRTQ